MLIETCPGAIYAIAIVIPRTLPKMYSVTCVRGMILFVNHLVLSSRELYFLFQKEHSMFLENT